MHEPGSRLKNVVTSDVLHQGFVSARVDGLVGKCPESVTWCRAHGYGRWVSRNRSRPSTVCSRVIAVKVARSLGMG